MFELSYPHRESRILASGSFTASVKWLLAYFFLCFLCFEIFNNVKKSYSRLFWIMTWGFFYSKIRRNSLTFLNSFMMNRNIQKFSSFMLILKLAGNLYLQTWRKLLMIMFETSRLTDLPKKAIANETFKKQSERKNWYFTT